MSLSRFWFKLSERLQAAGLKVIVETVELVRALRDMPVEEWPALLGGKEEGDER